MTLRKTTIDNSVRYVPNSEQTKKNIEPKTIKAGSLPRRQKNISRNSKNFLNKVAASVFAILK